MTYYRDDDISRLKQTADISIVIGKVVQLTKKKNGTYVGICPFHNDTRPSMQVNPEMGIYKCFSCGNGGDVFKFCTECLGMTFKEAVAHVAYSVGFDIAMHTSP